MSARVASDGLPVRAMHQLTAFRRTFAILLWLRATLWGIGAGLCAVALCLLLNVSREVTTQLAVLTAALTIALLGGMWTRGGVSLTRVALWIEERVPDLKYSLVTLAERSTPELEHFAAGVPWRDDAGNLMRKRLLRPLLFVAVAVAGVWVSSTSLAASAVAELANGPVLGGAVAGVGPVTVDVAPPAYTRTASQALENPSVVVAVVGSRLTFSAQALLNGRTLSATADSVPLRGVQNAGESRWRAVYLFPSRPVLVRLMRGDSSRLIAVEPRTDSVPGVLLLSPERDSVFRQPTGGLTIGARATDDFGIEQLSIEYIITTGSGERFEFRSGVLGQREGRGARSVEHRAPLVLRDLKLEPGDVVHLRAVARDQNTVTGPGIGYSETRTLRIARLGEYDSVAVEQAPPPDVDKALLSQRMLINLTEALIKKQPSMLPAAMQQEARAISRDQARLRKQVSDVVFARLGDGATGEHFHGDGHDHDAADATVGVALTPEELLKAAERATEISAEAIDFAHDETPVVAVNKPLLEAYNAMWEAGRRLDARELRAALPPMYAALDAIQRARSAERIYLRGAPARLVVDLSKTRLQGKEPGTSGSRRARDDYQSPQAIAEERTSAALRLAEHDAGAAADSLLVIRLDVLGSFPAVAAVLGRLSDGLRASRDVTQDVMQLRRSFGVRGGGAVNNLWSVVP